MPLLENLVEGLGEAAGSTGTVNDIEKRKQERLNLQHAELESNHDRIVNDVKRLQDQRSQLQPDSPTYQQDVARIDDALAKHQQAFTDLFHPTQQPDAFQKLGGFLKKHIARKEPARLPESNALTPERMGKLEASAAGTGTTDNPYLLKVKALEAAGVEHDEAVRLATGQKDKTANVKYGLVQGTLDGQSATLQHGADGTWKTMAGEEVDEDTLSRFQPTPKSSGAGGHSKFNEEAAVYEKAWGKKIADWNPEMLSYFNQKQAYDSARAGSSTVTRLEADEHGVVRPVTYTNFHGPASSPVYPKGLPPLPGMEPANVPKSPGEAKHRLSKVSPPKNAGANPNVRVGPPLDYRKTTPAITKAQTEFDEATALATVADQVMQKPDDATNVRGFAIALERARAGRYTDSALDKMLDAGWGNRLEQWANKPTTGSLPRDVIRQLVEGAHENVKGKQAALDAAHGGGSSSDTSGGDDEAIIKALGGK